METRRIVWTMLAVSIYLGLFSGEVGPTLPAQAGEGAATGASSYDDCVHVGPDGRVTVSAEDCAPITSPAVA